MDEVEVKYNEDDTLSVIVNGNTVLKINDNAFGWDNFELTEELTKRIANNLTSVKFNITDE